MSVHLLISQEYTNFRVIFPIHSCVPNVPPSICLPHPITTLTQPCWRVARAGPSPLPRLRRSTQTTQPWVGHPKQNPPPVCLMVVFSVPLPTSMPNPSFRHVRPEGLPVSCPTSTAPPGSLGPGRPSSVEGIHRVVKSPHVYIKHALVETLIKGLLPSQNTTCPPTIKCSISNRRTARDAS